MGSPSPSTLLDRGVGVTLVDALVSLGSGAVLAFWFFYIKANGD